MMTPRSTRLADQLDAAIDGRCFDLPDELASLVVIADAIREAARWGPVGMPARPRPVRRRRAVTDWAIRTLFSYRDVTKARSRMTVVTELADQALLLAEDPIPDEEAAAAELSALAAREPDPGTALLAALRLVGERGRAAGDGQPTLQTGRAARLLVLAHERT
jgi:hypothetical protein